MTLRDGEEQTIVVDIESLRRHDIRFEVLVDGEPAAARLDLRLTFTPDPAGRAQEDGFMAAVEDGRATLALAAGEWTVTPRVTVGSGLQVPFDSRTFHVPLAGDTGLRFDLRLGQRPVRILRPDGQPYAGLRLGLMYGPRRSGFSAKRTDEDGRTVVYGPVGTVALDVLKAPVQDPLSFHTWMQARSADFETLGAKARLDFETLYVTLPPIELLPGATETVELRLPEEWSEPPGK